MIVDQLKNAPLYYGLGKGIEKGLRYLEGNDFSDMDVGTYPIDGENIFAMVQEYDTKPSEKGAWEAHRKYIDIQFMVSGVELMGYTWLGHLNNDAEYIEERDVIKPSGKGDFFICRGGTFTIFFPEDGHSPKIALTKPEPVKKVVIKVSVDSL